MNGDPELAKRLMEILLRHSGETGVEETMKQYVQAIINSEGAGQLTNDSDRQQLFEEINYVRIQRGLDPLPGTCE